MKQNTAILCYNSCFEIVVYSSHFFVLNCGQHVHIFHTAKLQVSENRTVTKLFYSMTLKIQLFHILGLCNLVNILG